MSSGKSIEEITLSTQSRDFKYSTNNLLMSNSI